MKRSEKILVHFPNWVGDCVMATPALHAIRANNPEAHVAVVVRPQLRQIIEGLPCYDELIEFDSKRIHRGMWNNLVMGLTLRKGAFTLSIILPNSFGSASLSFFASIPVRVGYRTDCRGFLLTHSIPPPREYGRVVPLPMVERYLRICEHLHYTVPSDKPSLCFSQGTREAVDRLYRTRGIAKDKPMVSIIPGASFGSSKCWPPEYFAKVADRLSERYHVQILIIPGPGEEEIAARISSQMHYRPVAFADTIISLEQLKAVISDSDLVITNDTGPRHYAVAFDRPVVVIMGPTDPRYTNYHLSKTRLLQGEAECAPCHRKVCPTDHRCMKNVSPEQVIRACEEFLGPVLGEVSKTAQQG